MHAVATWLGSDRQSLHNFENAIVITGCIGSGKSTLSSLVRLYGYSVIDIDELSKEAFNEQNAQIQKMFNTLDRSSIARQIFTNKEKKKSIENLLHPIIYQKCQKKAHIYEKKNIPYFIDIPLFYETKNYNIKRVLLVFAPREILIQRITKRDNISVEDATLRLDSQMSMEEKRKLCSWEIDNSKDIAHLNKEFEKWMEAFNASRKNIS